MKTKDNVQKTIKKSLAVAASILLISLTVNAQDFWKTILENNSFNTIAMAMVEVDEVSSVSRETSGSPDMDAFAKYLDIEKEDELELESWMISNFSTPMNTVETEAENKLELEDWMMDENNFDVYPFNFGIENEKPLELENWMLNDLNFNRFEFQETDEEEARLESWMTNNVFWEIG